MKNLVANIMSVFSLSLSMMGSLNEIITILVLLSAFGLNISGIIKNLNNKNHKGKE